MNDAENKKPPFSKPAVASFLLAISGLCLFIVLLLSRDSRYRELLVNVLALTVGFLISTGFALGIISHWRIRKSNNQLRGKAFSTSGLVLCIVTMFVITLMPPIPHRRTYYMLSCGYNLRGLGAAMILYADDHNNQYPSYMEWCDLLKKQEDINDKQFVCKSAVKNNDKGRCHYALNPNWEPNSPNDVVFLFETKGGWNQYGGPELISFDNHVRKGANVLFNDGHVEFIQPKDIGKLKWKPEPNEINQPVSR